MSKVSKRTKKFDINLPTRFVSDEFVSELLSIVDREIDVEGSFRFKYLKEEILSKYLDPKIVPEIDRARAGVTKWLSAEQRNLETNGRLFYLEIVDADLGWTSWSNFLFRVKSLIAKILGQLPDLTRKGQISSKASSRVHRSETAALEKLKGECHVSSSALNHFQAFWADAQFKPEGWRVHDTSTMFTVVKKTDIDRVACKEPEGNMLLQRIVGIAIRDRLRRKAGINLLDQTRNQQLSQVASTRGDLATIDLSSASDSISTMLVQLLLPTEWWSLLDDLRVKQTRIPGNLLGDGRTDEILDLNMFSSMGNGFTFELQSLIFYAIVKTARNIIDPCDSSVVSVYGDDIICSSDIVSRVKEVFDLFGFTMNPKKTNFSRENLFRESCGKHYYAGFDVSPFYIRKAIRTIPDLILILNQLLGWDGRGWGCFTTPSFIDFHEKWSHYVPKRLHGAVDVDETGALVTGARPRDWLIPVTRTVDVELFEQERYLLWFLDSERAGEAPANPVIGHYVDPLDLDLRVKVIGKSARVDWEGALSDSHPERIVGFRPAVHVERRYKGRRTTWHPYALRVGL